MSGAAKVNINVTNLTQSVTTPVNGVTFLQGRSVRGPFASPNEVINSWNRFVTLYGGLSTVSDAPLLAKRILEKGGSVRFSRVGHYADITDSTSLDAVEATQPEVTVLTFDDELVTGNEVDFEVTGGGLHNITFTLNSDNTMQMIADALNTEQTVGSAVVIEVGGADNNNRVIFVTPAPGQNFSLDSIIVTGGATQANVSQDLVDTITNSNGDDLFEILPKYPGEDYNNFQITITPGSNGSPNYFDVNIQHITDPTISESYPNLTIPMNSGINPDITGSAYLNDITTRSQFFKVVYKDLSALPGQQVPMPISYRLTGGSDGSLPDDTDYIGDSASRNGFYAFDEYDDSYYLATLDNDNDAVIVAGAAYAFNRKDLIYMIELPLSIKTKAGIIQEKDSWNIDNPFTYIFGGGLKLTDPFTSQVKDSKAMGDVLALAVQSDINYGPWYSFAGPNRGLITGALGVVNNFGAPANHKDLDDLANRRINMVINRSGSIKLWGNFSGQLKEDQERFTNIVKLIIFLKKSLKPTLETFLEEPNDIPTWRRIYFTVKPFMDSLVTKRAIYTYDWQGDQFVNSMNDLQINNPSDVSDGKYKILLPIQAIPSLQEINLGIILTKAGVTFDVVLQQI